jgi:RHH-type transcriptional regulator, rel operon repressor / antitoxin RelB
MASSTFSVRVDSGMKKRLEKLAESTGRSRSFLTAEALNEYLDVNEWQVAGIRQAISSLDKGEGMSHADVRRTIKSWERRSGRAPTKRVRA